MPFILVNILLASNINPMLDCLKWSLTILNLVCTSFDAFNIIFQIKYWSKNRRNRLFCQKTEFLLSSTTTTATTPVWCVDKKMKRATEEGSVRISATSFYPFFASLPFSIIRIQTNQRKSVWRRTKKNTKWIVFGFYFA